MHSACILDADINEELVIKLRPEHFFRPAHQIIFESIRNLTQRNIPVDQISLADTLQSAGQLEAVGGRPYLAELADYSCAR
ncbi:DnaB-like helicase N-terminal domain-containing protein, partial [Adlercreutzia equolifaciens]|uniref:DnaB-like helicase N-terminal domain-containing protein n=1 Tax=Adlercreutzia equolifaciens TaxID=446660 RepID=UPI0023B065AC